MPTDCRRDCELRAHSNAGWILSGTSDSGLQEESFLNFGFGGNDPRENNKKKKKVSFGVVTILIKL